MPLDRSTPYYLRASYKRAFAEGPYRFRLRARGASRLFVDGKMVVLIVVRSLAVNTNLPDSLFDPDALRRGQ